MLPISKMLGHDFFQANDRPHAQWHTESSVEVDVRVVDLA